MCAHAHLAADTSILHHAFISVFIALWAVTSHYVTILMAILSYFFLPESSYIELELESGGLQGAHEVGGAPPTLVDRWWAPWPSSFARIFYYLQKDVPWRFRSFRELLFLHINNTMAILLKTTSVRVSSIQIMQIRVQNKGKKVWKSRYDRDVSTPPSLTHCLSSSNSVDKLKVIKKNFYKLCLILLL